MLDDKVISFFSMKPNLRGKVVSCFLLDFGRRQGSRSEIGGKEWVASEDNRIRCPMSLAYSCIVPSRWSYCIGGYSTKLWEEPL